MEDPLGQAYADVILPLLAGTSGDCPRVIATYFTPTCSIHHPLFRLVSSDDSRAKACEIFSSRLDTFKSTDTQNRSIAFDDSNTKLFCDVTRTMSMRYVPFTSAQVSRTIILIELVDHNGFYKIKRWEEFLQPDDLTALLLLPGARAATNGLRGLAATVAASLPTRWPFSAWSSSGS